MVNNLVSVETQTEYSVTSGERETRIFVKMYVDAVHSGLIADMGAERWQTLCVIAAFMNEKGECYPTQAQIAKGLGVSRQAASNRVRKLLEYRWQGEPVIVARQARDNGQFSALKYSLVTDLLVPAKENSFAVVTFNKPHKGAELSYEEKVLARSIPGYTKWVEEVKRLADYKCIRCGSSKRLVAHHLNNYRDFPEERTDVENGACLCAKCHYTFHGTFGLSGTTAQDFARFMGEDVRDV